jgi:hypothetical protein
LEPVSDDVVVRSSEDGRRIVQVDRISGEAIDVVHHEGTIAEQRPSMDEGRAEAVSEAELPEHDLCVLAKLLR